MSSRFYYPTTTGSLADRRRLGNFSSSLSPETLSRFSSKYFGAMEERKVDTASTSPEPIVLVVEDDNDCLFLLKNVLSAKGYRVLEAWDGKQAMELAEGENLDLILLDIQLPRLSGLGVVSRLRENPKLESLPIVVMTGHVGDEYRRNAIAAGCDDFLLKPIDFDRLDVVLDYYAPLKIVSAP
jgi:two-component system, cell cycle response regulator DivK